MSKLIWYGDENSKIFASLSLGNIILKYIIYIERSGIYPCFEKNRINVYNYSSLDDAMQACQDHFEKYFNLKEVKVVE